MLAFMHSSQKNGCTPLYKHVAKIPSMHDRLHAMLPVPHTSAGCTLINSLFCPTADGQHTEDHRPCVCKHKLLLASALNHTCK